MRPETAAAIAAVQRALAVAPPGPANGEVTSKARRDIVTTTDVAVEDLVRAELRPLGLPVVGEERGGSPSSDGAAYWLVDPICGTRNYASGVPLWCINLALVERGEVALAVVGDPSRQEMTYAERGHGAWALVNGSEPRRLYVSDETLTLVIEEGKSAGPRREHAARFMAEAVLTDRWDFRSLGTTLAMPYLAAGRVAAYVVFIATSVHTAAGSLLVSEAGGLLSDLEGEPWTLESDSLLFSARAPLHTHLLDLARQCRP